MDGVVVDLGWWMVDLQGHDGRGEEILGSKIPRLRRPLARAALLRA